MASYRLKPGQLVKGALKKIFKKKYVVTTDIELDTPDGARKMQTVTVRVEAYNKEKACQAAREDINKRIVFKSEAIIAK